MRNRSVFSVGCGTFLLIGFGLASCSSSGGNNKTGTAGSSGTSGTAGATGTGGSGGSAGTGGSVGGAGGSGVGGTGGSAAAGTGGSAVGGTGGSAAGGTGGSAAGGTGGSAGAGGSGGSAGAGGTGGTACPADAGDPPVTEHNSCTGIASQKQGAADFTISSPDFANCGVIPAADTCDGHAFGTGPSPALTWSGAPTGTMSFALVFKDIAILADNNPATERMGYHWVMWDIQATKTGLPAGLMGGYHSPDVTGALQWANRNNYRFLPPCPNPFPATDSRFTCGLVIDSYAFTLYALPTAHLTNLPAPDFDATTGAPTGNYVVKMGHTIESLSALAVTEYRGTSKAWATSFAPPTPAQYPCSAIPADAGTTSDAATSGDGGTGDGGTSMCLQ